MNGGTHAYLDLAALPAVGGFLLDPRPAWIFAGDGTAVLWANAAGARFFGVHSMGALLGRRIGGGNPVVRQLARLARVLPASAPRLEILRFASDFRLNAVAASCRRLNLSNGRSAVLAVAAAEATADSIVSRAEALADMLAGEDCLAAVIDASGRIVGASGGFHDLSPASATIDALVDEIESGKQRIVKRSIRIADRMRPAGAARFEAGGEDLALLIVGPAEEARRTTGGASGAAEPERAGARQEDSTGPAAAARPPAPPAPVVAPAVRFVWQVDQEQRFTFVSPELARVVGPSNGDIVGHTWREVADRLGLDRDGRIQAALDARSQWSGIKTYWPTATAGVAIAAELSGFPVNERGIFGGQRGLGILRPGDERRAPAEPVDQLSDTIEPGVPRRADDAAAPAEATGEAQPPSDGDETDDADAAARKSVEQGLRVVAGRDAPPAEVAAADHRQAPAAKSNNVVRLHGTQPTPPPPPERLSGSERDAFRRIAETLGVRQESEAPSEALPEAPQPAAEHAGNGNETPAPPIEPDTRFLDRLPIGIVVFRQSETLFVNRALLDLLGYADAGDFAAAGGPEALFPDRDADPRKTAAGETATPLSARHKDGSKLAVEAQLQSVTWTGLPGLMLVVRPRAPAPEAAALPGDVRDEIAAVETRLGELEAILDTATDGVIVIDGNGRIGNLNKSAEALFGVEAGDVLGTPFTDLLAEESRKAALDYLDGLASNGVASVLNDGREVIGKVPQGGLIPLFMTMGRLGETGKFCAVLRDITHWKNVEEELVAARRAAETASTLKSEFLAKISHEIRTPLNAIIGFSEVMMEERFGPIGNARYRGYLRDINTSGAHLMSLINDLLDLSKIEAGKLELAFEAVAPNQAIQECVALMQPQANRERIIIRTSLSADVPNVVADPRSLRQILLNLLSNAIKFTRPGGQVIVSTAIEATGEVAIRIRDTGVGMSEKDIEMALKPFRQLATSGRERGEGTGLGLPLTKALVEANRAAFTIDSAVNQGTLVKITFPTTRVLAG